MNLSQNNKDLKFTFRRTAGEALFLKDMNESQDKLTSENNKKIKILNDDIAESEKIDKQLKGILTKEKLEKDNLYRALMTYTKQFDSNLANDLDELYKSLNNQYFLSSYRPVDGKIVEDLFGKINYLNNEIQKKDAELSSINKLLPDKKYSTKSSIDLKRLPSLQSKASLKGNIDLKKK